jgi:Spy/CpxP family protein refolding chaperone
VQAHEAMQAADQAPAPKAVTRPRRTVSPLDRRIALLAKELDLDAAQQARVRALLEAQRQQVARVWNDTSIPAANRVGATQGIGDHTADQIRSLLTEEQRKKYIQPRRREAAVGTAGSNVESWMNSDKLTAKP